MSRVLPLRLAMASHLPWRGRIGKSFAIPLRRPPFPTPPPRVGRRHGQDTDRSHQGRHRPLRRPRRQSRHRRREVRRRRDHRIVVDADRGLPLGGRQRQPGAAALRPATGQAPRRRGAPVRLWPRAVFLGVRRRDPDLRGRRGRVDLRGLAAHPGARAAERARRSTMSCWRSRSCSRAAAGRSRCASSPRPRATWAGGTRSTGRRIRPASSCCSRIRRRWPGWSSPAIGVWASHAFNDPRIDGVASIAIGVILGARRGPARARVEGAADRRARRPGGDRRRSARIVAAHPAIVSVNHVRTIHTAPDSIFVAISADFDDSITMGDGETMIEAMETELNAAVPMLSSIYIRPEKREDATLTATASTP